MKFLIFLVLSIICSVHCSAQGERINWYFGHYAGLTFNNLNAPIPLLNGNTRAAESCASISNSNGNLLFYANGIDTSTVPYFYFASVWNRNHQPMQNSNGIYGIASITQGQTILPFPSDSNKYFLFSIRLLNSPYNWNLYYSIIDMQLDSGRGAVVQKNVLLCDTDITEKMIAVKHANGRDWWLLVHEKNTANFFEYLLTPNGISGPTIITGGSCIACGTAYDQGQMVFSKDGSKLCVANGFGVLDLYNFDRCSGTLTLNQNLGVSFSALFGWTTFYGCSFSEDGQVLYASRFDTLWQYDLNASNIKASRLYLMSVNNAEYFIGQHLIAADNKIYISTARNSGSVDSLDYKLTVINYPDSVGLACDIRPHSIWLGGHRARGGLPNLPHYELGALTGSMCDTLTALPPQPINTKTLKVYPNPASRQLTINCPQLRIGQPVTVKVYDVLGQEVLSETIQYKIPFQLSVTALSHGLYVVQVQQNNFNGIVRFVK
jgi:hypothetical protein